MEEIYDTYAYFWVSGFDCDPKQITDLIGLEPTNIIHKGEPLKNGRVRQHSFWEIHSSLPRTEKFQDAHLSNLIPTLMAKQKEIAKLKSLYKVGINCVGYYTNVNSGFHLDSALIKQCAELNLDIDFDLYNFS